MLVAGLIWLSRLSVVNISGWRSIMDIRPTRPRS
jgi:hypothetical protein